jgi:hypothetical protein
VGQTADLAAITVDAREEEPTQVAPQHVINLVIQSMVKNHHARTHSTLKAPSSLSNDVDVPRVRVAMYVSVHER